MDRMDCLNALYLDDNQPLDNQIDPVAQFDLFPIVYNRQSDLTRYFDSTLSQLMSKTSLVSTFQQPRPEYSMNVHGGRHDGPRDLIDPQNWSRR
ncbi:MAG: hypothetical protein WB919_09380 [Candidatus Sulfotelmatobacter sp.]